MVRWRIVAIRWKSTGAALAAVAVATVAAIALRPYLAPVNLAMLFVLAVAIVSARGDWVASFSAAFAGVAAFDFFCVPPYHTFAIADAEYLVTFAAMLAVASSVQSRSRWMRTQARDSAAREARAQILFRLSERLSSETRLFELARAAAELTAEALQCEVVVFLRDGDSISFDRRTSDRLPVPRSELSIADWVFRHGKKAGRGEDSLLNATALYVPLRGVHRTMGVMACLFPDPAMGASGETGVLVDLVANHIALAMERVASQHAAEDARLRMETEQMRSSLLSAVSHDLLTPLATITGAASALRQQGERLPRETREELLESIGSEADRLTRLVRNLLDMTRFSSGAVELRKDAYPLEEIAGAALHRLETSLAQREVVVDLPPDLPLVYGDEVLLGQVFSNLLENAIKYTAPGTKIEIRAQAVGSEIEVTVRDRGPGIRPGQETRIFDKFYRGSKDRASGSGLGLAIAKAVVEAHGGRIFAFNHAEGGAVFRFFLPAHPVPVEHGV